MADEKDRQRDDSEKEDRKPQAVKTETSRLKTRKPQKDDRGKGGAAKEEANQAESGAAEDTSVTDPMAMRDTNTSKVRRLTGGKAGPEATAVVPGSSAGDEKQDKTDTVQLKVVQQKKKEIADMMSPSSTVRLRAPGGKRGKTGGRLPGQKARDTLKVHPPDNTVQQSPEQKEPESTQTVSSAAGAKTSTQPLKKITSKQKDGGTKPGTGKTVKTSGGAPKLKSEDKGKRTLKIKTGGPQGTVRTGGKPQEGGGETAKPEPAEGEETVRVPPKESEKTVKAGTGGLRLKQRASEASKAAAGPAAQPPAVAALEENAHPGIGFTLAAAAAFAATGVLLFFLVQQTLTHL